ncbi:uncharacterized protein LOC132188255 isoform X1 [Corylus avellana]|uniref:uncharacterized protein LOC132188255 isoform X1 n=1 Tax=Corylus avellana TaxID=13451 RepID=UPI00286D16A5|nr:uncharacterized protein LOC132188255 isoform X1 [Corylus avellana]
MSVSDKEIFNVGASGGGIHVREDDGTQQREDRYVSGGGCTRDFAKAKQLILHALTKAEKQLLRRRNKKISSSSASANAGTSGGHFSLSNVHCYNEEVSPWCFSHVPCLLQDYTTTNWGCAVLKWWRTELDSSNCYFG